MSDKEKKDLFYICPLHDDLVNTVNGLMNCMNDMRVDIAEIKTDINHIKSTIEKKNNVRYSNPDLKFALSFLKDVVLILLVAVLSMRMYIGGG